MNILLIKLSPLQGLTSSMMRAVGLVKGLVQLGHQVDVLTTPNTNQQLALRAAPLVQGDGIRLFETGKSKAYAALVAGSGKQGIKQSAVRLLRKVYHWTNIYDHTVRIARAVSRQGLRDSYDLIISVSDPKPSHIAARVLMDKGIQAKRWIQYWGDPMALDITNKSKLPRFLYRRAEYKMLRGADRVFYTNPFTLAAQQQLFPRFASKLACTPTANSFELVCSKEAEAPFCISYIGAYYSRVRNLLPFYEACQGLPSGCETCIVGDSDLALENSPGIIVLPRGEVEMIEQRTDLFICLLNSKGTQIPGKVYHYAVSNRPILVILDGEHQDAIRDYLAAFDRYVFCQNTPQAIRQAILDIKDSDKVWQPATQFRPATIAQAFLMTD